MMRCIDWENVGEVKFVNSMVDGFACWNLETIEGCGLKWISREAKKFLLEGHGVDPRLVVENFDIGRTFDRYYPKDMVLRNCLSNNKPGFEKLLVREHLTPKSEMKKPRSSSGRKATPPMPRRRRPRIWQSRWSMFMPILRAIALPCP